MPDIDRISLITRSLARTATVIFFALHGAVILFISYLVAIGQGRAGAPHWISIPLGILGLGLLRIAYWAYEGKVDAFWQRIRDWGARKLSV